METGTWKVRHHLTYLRLMYHHHIFTREDGETIKKIYMKQKEGTFKGDWLQLIKKDFKFLDVDMNEVEIQATPKEEYKKKIKNMINISAFKQFLKIKEKHSKLDEVHFSELKIQSYLKSSRIQNKEK